MVSIGYFMLSLHGVHISLMSTVCAMCSFYSDLPSMRLFLLSESLTNPNLYLVVLNCCFMPKDCNHGDSSSLATSSLLLCTRCMECWFELLCACVVPWGLVLSWPRFVRRCCSSRLFVHRDGELEED